MATSGRPTLLGLKLPVWPRAILSGFLIGMTAANIWPLFLLNLGAPLAAIAEAIFLAVYVWWAGGGGPPRGTKAGRSTAVRRGRLSTEQWFWGALAAFFFAAAIHASIVVLFRLTPYSTASFRQGYDFSFIPTLPLRWLAVGV
jgi:hypothetical protein